MHSPLLSLELDVANFRQKCFDLDAETASAAGYQFHSMAWLGDTFSNRQRLYAFAQKFVNDSPDTDAVENGFWEFINEQIAVPAYDPRGVILTVLDGEWVGISVTSPVGGEDYLMDEFTWVAPEHRRRGLAIAMKVQALQFAKSYGAAKIRVVLGSDDGAQVSLYRTLGFKEPLNPRMETWQREHV